ncbi:MAG: response regulator [Elusimicrobia bacterium]|nr:response regulator [Elusimicrobiota bacterium]
MAEILVVEDDEYVNQLMVAILSRAGHQVASCATGLEALKKLGVEPPDPSVKPPDLLVLDIMMPGADGYVVGTLIRNTPHTRDVRILVVSALQELSRVFTETVSLDGYLVKPFAPDDLIGTVTRILGIKNIKG